MQLQQQLLNRAFHLLKKKKDIPVIVEDPEQGLILRQEWNDNSPLTITELRAHGLMPQQFIDFFKHQHEIVPEYSQNITFTKIDRDEGFDVFHQRFQMPFLITNRSFFNTTYHIDGSEPGEYQFIVSSLGNRDYEHRYANLAQRDVIGKINLNYLGIRPIKQDQFSNEIIGTYVTQV